MYFHIHIHIPPAWNYVGDVEKNGYPTSQQAKRRIAKEKQNRTHKQTCGSIGQFTSKKRKNANNSKKFYLPLNKGRGSLESKKESELG